MKLTLLNLGKIAALTAIFCLDIGSDANAAYFQTNLVSNNPAYNPQFLDPYLQGSRSIAIRTAGFGGHFWINNIDTGTVTEYVGDVGDIPLFQDGLTVVTIPASPNNPSGMSSPTGQVFINSQDFVITLDHPNGAVTAPSKFLFASLDGTISGWTDRKRPDGTNDWPIVSTIVVDRFQESIYYGVTVSDLASDNRIYAVDFGETPGIEVFDRVFNEITSNVVFANPFESEGYAAYNIQTFDGSLYVTYAQQSTESLGSETIGAGLGRIAQFDFNGNLINTWEDGGLLNVPAGLAIAPSDFGEFSNSLLVANFGDGTIVGFDPNTRQPLGYLEDSQGNPIVIPGLWGLTFGNGASLGEANHLYFAAGPEDGSNDGLFGKLQSVPEPGSVLALFVVSGVGVVSSRRTQVKQHKS
jgi:uncharacterized protein (TIGR03118 family)